MTAKCLVPVVQSAEGEREAQGGIAQTFRDAHLQIDGNFLKRVVVSFHLSAEVLGYGREAEVALFIEVVQSEIDANGQ